jgi:hypothetical protein
MNNDGIDPIVFTLDDSQVREGINRGNTDIQGYRQHAIEANKDVGDSFQKSALMVQSSVDRNRSSLDRMSTGVREAGQHAERMGQGLEGAFRGASHAAKGYIELAGAVALATKATVAHAQASSILEGILNRARAARVGVAAFTEGLGGATVVAAEIAGVIAVEKIIEATYQRGRELQKQALEMQRSGFGYQDTVALDFTSKRQGVAPDFFNSAVKSAGGVDQLAQKLKELGEVQDPVDRVHQAFLAFGADFEKMLPYIGDRFGENVKSAREWGLALDNSLNQRKNIGQFITDIDRLRGSLKGVTDDFHAFAQSGGNWLSGAFGSVWDAVVHGIPEVADKYIPNYGARKSGAQILAGADRKNQLTTQGMIVGATGQTIDTYAAQGSKYFQANRTAGTPFSPLEKQLFNTDLTSPEYGKQVSGAAFPGGYSARALVMQDFVTGQRRTADTQKKKDADDASAKALKEIAAAQKEVDSIVRSSQLSELSGIEKLKAERDNAINQYGKTKDLVEQINGAFDTRIVNEWKKELDAAHAGVVKFGEDVAKAAMSINDARSKVQMSTIGEAYKLNAEGGRKRSDLALQTLGIQRDSQIAAAETGIAGGFDPDNLRGRNEERSLTQKVAIEGQKFQIESDYLTKSRDLQAAGIAGDRDAAIASYKVLLDTKLINDNAFQAVRKNIEINADLDLQKLSAKTDSEIAAASNQAAIAAAKLMGEEYRREFETIEQSAQGLFHTLFTKPAQFGKQLGETLREAMLKPVIDGMSKMTANVLQPVIYGSDGKSGISGMFKGVFGGKSDNPLVPLTQQSNIFLATIVAMMAGSMGIAAPSVPGAPTVSVPTPSAIYRNASPPEGASIGPPPPLSREWLTSFGPESVRAGARGSVMNPGGGYGIGFGGWGNTFSTAAGIAPFLQPMQSVSGSSGSGYVPGGSVSSSIDYGKGPVSLGGSYYPGSGSFNAAVGGGGFSGSGAPGAFGFGIVPSGGTSSATSDAAKIFNAAASGKLGSGPGGFGLGNVKAMGSNLGKAIGYQGDGIWKSGDSLYGASGSGMSGPAGFPQIAGSIARSPVAGATGMMLAQAGIFGQNRGTWTGIAEGTAGGALIGEQYGGPLGAGIGAAVGFGVTLGEKLAGVMSPVNEAKKDVKQAYGINIDNKTANQIVQVAKDKYAGHIGIAVRSPEVRQMLQLYSAGTGQKFPLSASTPHAGSLAEQNGTLNQVATTQFGQAYTYQSNLPVLGPPSTGTYPGGGGPTYVSLHVDGSSTADFMNGQIATTVNPSFVQDQYSGALNASNGRLNNSAMIQAPGLIVS